MRIYAIGDIHGGLKALQQLMEKLPLDVDDRIIFLGDYVDGWSESCGVVRYLIELDKKYTCIFIRGNHDEWCEQWLINGIEPEDWAFHGGKLTMQGYREISEKEQKEHLDFFNRLRDYYTDEENRLFIHAGFSSMHGPSKEHYKSNFVWDRSLWEMALVMDKSLIEDSPYYPKRLKHFKEIYIGHTPVTKFGFSKPVQLANLWNIDTGAAFKGCISAIDVETHEIWQSDPVHELYPDEKGRNK